MDQNKNDLTNLNYKCNSKEEYIKMNQLHYNELKNYFKSKLFRSGKIASSIYFFLFLFSMQSLFLRQNLEFKTKNFISD